MVKRSNNKCSGYLDSSPRNVAKQMKEKAAIQALGDMLLTVIAGVSAQYTYIAEFEAAFVGDQSPLLRTVLIVARALAARAAA